MAKKPEAKKRLEVHRGIPACDCGDAGTMQHTGQWCDVNPPKWEVMCTGCGKVALTREEPHGWRAEQDAKRKQTLAVQRAQAQLEKAKRMGAVS